jgi:arginase
MTVLQIIGVPIDSVGRAGGTEHSPAVLRELGLVEELERRGARVEDAGDLDVRVRGELRDPVTGVVAWPDVASMTDVVRSATETAILDRRVPVLIGGCCALEPGAVAGAHRALGDVGLVHVDGHLDVYTGATSPTGEAADMPCAALLGLGPDAWASRLADGPVLRGDQVVALGHRDPDELTDGSLDLARRSGVISMPVDRVQTGAEAAGVAAASALDAPTWVHLDVDVLDEVAFPATDYLLPGGLTVDELHAALRGVVAGGRVVGFSLGCYNPEKDADRASGRALVGVLADVLSRV